MFGLSWASIALRVAAGTRVAAGHQHRVALAGGPGGGGHRPVGPLAGDHHHVVGGPALRGGDEAVDRGGALVGVLALDHRGLEPARAWAGLSPIRITCASLERSEPLGLSRSSVSALADGQVAAVGEQEGRPDGAGREHRGRSRRPASPPCRPARRRSGGWTGRGAGKTALATPAASAAASPPPTRIVFLVADGREAELGRGLLVVRAGPAAAGGRRRRRGCTPPGAPEHEQEGGESARRIERQVAGAPARIAALARRPVAAGPSAAAVVFVLVDWSVNRWLTGQAPGPDASIWRTHTRGFQAQRRTARVPAALPPLRARGHPAHRRQVRPRAGRAVGGHQGRPRVEPARPRAHHARWAPTPTACSA